MANLYQTGIDVSRYQAAINWTQVAQAGKQFAIVRALSSDDNGVYVDARFAANVAGAAAAGLRVGAYYYTYAQTMRYVDQEINALTKVLRGKKFQYPIFVDVEDASLKRLGRSRLTTLVLYAMQRLRANGYYPGVYTYKSFAQEYLDMRALEAYPVFIADYVQSPDISYDLWQYSSSGIVPGISTRVDLDYAYKDFLPSITAGGYNGYPKNSAPVAMVPLKGMQLEVFGTKNCQYFNMPDVNDVAGTLPNGVYPAVAQSEGCYNGFTWVTLRYRGKVYWTALLADRCVLRKA